MPGPLSRAQIVRRHITHSNGRGNYSTHKNEVRIDSQSVHAILDNAIHYTYTNLTSIHRASNVEELFVVWDQTDDTSIAAILAAVALVTNVVRQTVGNKEMPLPSETEGEQW